MQMRVILPVLVFLGAGCLSPGALFAQSGNISFEHFGRKEGIPGAVTKIVQDSFGFLWLGTMDGLCRFDGKNVVQYRNFPADPHSLANNIINELCVDSENRIWAATNGGLCYYDFADGLFHQVMVDISLEPVDQHRVHAVIPAKDGGLWFTTKSVLHRWKDGNTVSSYRLPDFSDGTNKCLYEDTRGIWIGTNRGLYLFNPGTKTFVHKVVTTEFSIANRLEVTLHPVLPYSGDTMLIGGWYGGVQKVLYADGEIVCIPIIDEIETDPKKYVVKAVCHGMEDRWWVGSYGNGLSVWDKSKGTFTYHFHHDPGNPNSLVSDYILDVFMDASGILWIATDRGLDKLDPLAQQFFSIPIPITSSEFSVYRLAASVKEDLQDPDYLWICVPGAGIFHFNTRTKTFSLFQNSPDDPSSLPDNSVHITFVDHNGTMWVGTRSRLCMFDPNRVKFSPAPIQIPGVHMILQDEHKNYWFGTHSDGIYKYDPIQDTVTHLRYDPSQPNTLTDNRVFCMLLDSNGDLWIGTQNRGLCKLDPDTGVFTYFQHNRSDPTSLPDNGVYELYEDSKGILWITTENGFAEMDRSQNVFKTYSTADGLCNNTVYSIIPDLNEMFWLATNGGFSRFDPVKKEFRNYYTHDGLPSNSISGAMLMRPDGTLYFGSTGMINYCQPKLMKMNRRIPPVIITQFKILDKEYSVRRTRDMIEPIDLTYRQNMITFEFSALNFTHSTLNQYAYKLEGFDDQWIYCGQKQSATYTNLDGGHYTFRVKAANNDGLWNETGTFVSLIVHPPYWRTWWFYTVIAAVVLGLLFLLYRFRIRHLMQIQLIRLRISRDLHDDIGSTLSSINMISSMATQAPQDGQKSVDKFSVIAAASRQAMELMSDIVWSIHPSHDRMEMLIVRMRQYTSEILEAAKIAFTLDLDEAAKKAILPIEKRKDFYLIYKEAINNLAKHSKARHATIQISMQHKTLLLTIRDDGSGFDPEKPYPGNGIKNIKSRAAQIHGQVDFRSQQGKGTAMTLQVPLTS